MANQEHLDKIRKGVDVWNKWRDEHPDTQPDLSDVSFKGHDLSCVNFSYAELTKTQLNRADLSKSNLYGAELNGANLSYADLYDTDLSYADLFNANLSSAELNGANLSYADLYDADLFNANLSNANLSYVNLSSAILQGTIMSGVDLRTAKGLLEVRHRGRSRIELHTIQLPQDGSALHFLRGAGVSDEWIDFYQATMQKAIHYYSCFISYSSNDYEIAKRLHADLQDQGVRCWFAPHDLVPGDYFREKIDQAIHIQDKLLLILSTHSMNSAWVQHEVRKALNREANQNRTILFPLSLDGSVFKSPSTWAQELREERHIGDFTQWETYEVYKQKFQTLLKQLKSTEVKS